MQSLRNQKLPPKGLAGLPEKLRILVLVLDILWYEQHFFLAHMDATKSSGGKTKFLTNSNLTGPISIKTMALHR